MVNEKNSSSKEKNRDKSTVRMRGTRAGKKVKNYKNQRKSLDLLLLNLAAQCSSSNYTKKIANKNIVNNNKSSNKSSSDTSFDIDNSQSSKKKAKAWSSNNRGKRAGRQVHMKYECKKLVTFLSALAQECASH